MSAVAVDTHAIVWYLSNDKRLSGRATEALDQASASGDYIYVPSICLVELTYLIEKGRLPSIARERLIRAFDEPSTSCKLAPLDRRVADMIETINRNEVPDMPNRVIATTAAALKVPLISRDGKIQSSKIETLW
jgi:PIN domain nuclease of toxin-antitoxin system